MIGEIVTGIKRIAGSNRVAAVFLPALVGLLPSLGGARFSCPLVDAAVMGNGSNGTKAFVNTWYRHVLMDGFVLYAGIILASGILSVPVGELFVRLMVFVVMTAVCGFFFGTAHIRYEKTENGSDFLSGIRALLVKMSPIIAVIALYMVLLKLTTYALEIALLAVNAALFIYFRYGARQILAALRKAFVLKYIIIIVGVMIFKDILVSSSVMRNLPLWIESLSVPKHALFILLPLIAGMLTGMSVGYVSISFPVLLALGLQENIWYGVIAYAAGNIGQMVSPLHLCNIITAEYFKVPVNKLLLRIAAAEVPVLAALIVALLLI